MDGMHDLGGRQGFGKVGIVPEASPFQAPWEQRAYALRAMAIQLGIYNIDEYRHAVERMDPRHAMSASYYEKVITAIATLLVEKGVTSRAELEAMAGGTACIATDAGADGEVLEGGAGIVISTQGVTTQLRTLLPVLRDQPVLTAELGRRARQRALERYTLEGNINALEALYAELVPQGSLVV